MFTTGTISLFKYFSSMLAELAYAGLTHMRGQLHTYSSKSWISEKVQGV